MSKSKRVILDSGPVITLSKLDKIELLTRLFGEIYIPTAVWDEVTGNRGYPEIPRIIAFFKERVKDIHSSNDLSAITGKGEAEAVLLYRELNADFLIIDDKKARFIFEALGVNCIGTLAILMKAKEKGYEKELKPLFKQLLDNKRFFKEEELNRILLFLGEQKLSV